eukprot:8104848-Pyramimonas_sp.AAC.1
MVLVMASAVSLAPVPIGARRAAFCAAMIVGSQVAPGVGSTASPLPTPFPPGLGLHQGAADVVA